MKYTTGLENFQSLPRTRFAGEVSSLVGITASVVQASSLGPACYIVNAADLRPRHDGNVITKFADDTNLIIPTRNSQTRRDEVSHVKSWASNNNLQLNCSKSYSRPVTQITW